jgi:hypothetical protein
MGWVYTMSPIVPGLTIIADPVDSRIAELVGVPVGSFSGPITIAATDGTLALTRVVMLESAVPVVTSIASLEFDVALRPTIEFRFQEADLDLIRLNLLFEFKEQIPIKMNVTPKVRFEFTPIQPIGPVNSNFEPSIEFFFTETIINNGS